MGDGLLPNGGMLHSCLMAALQAQQMQQQQLQQQQDHQQQQQQQPQQQQQQMQPRSGQMPPQATLVPTSYAMGGGGRAANLDGVASGLSGALSGALAGTLNVNGLSNPACLSGASASYGLAQAPHAHLAVPNCNDSTNASMSSMYGSMADSHARSMAAPTDVMGTDGSVLGGDTEADAFHRAAVLLSGNLGGGRGE